MKGNDLTTRQAGKIYDALRPTLGFLTQLETRLAEMGFAPTECYYELVRDAQNSLQRLTVETHYLSCEGGVGRARRE